MDPRGILAEFEANGDKSSPEASDVLEEKVRDKGHKSVEVLLTLSGVRGRNDSGWRQVIRMVELVSILDGVEKYVMSAFPTAVVFYVLHLASLLHGNRLGKRHSV